MGDNGLTGKQQLFVGYYLDTLNATKAAKRAGYKGSYGTLRSVGSENLTKPNIIEAIQTGMAGLAMHPEEILTRLTAMARGKLPTRKDDTRIGMIEHYDAIKALELLGKEHALFTERIEHSGVGGLAVSLVWPEENGDD